MNQSINGHLIYATTRTIMTMQGISWAENRVNLIDNDRDSKSTNRHSRRQRPCSLLNYRTSVFSMSSNQVVHRGEDNDSTKDYTTVIHVRCCDGLPRRPEAEEQHKSHINARKSVYEDTQSTSNLPWPPRKISTYTVDRRISGVEAAGPNSTSASSVQEQRQRHKVGRI